MPSVEETAMTCRTSVCTSW